jgi:hypothetical protein
MNRQAGAIVSFLMTMASAVLAASTAAALEPGEYEVTVRLDLPHAEGATAPRTARICVTAGGPDTHGLTVLIASHAFTGCAASNIREDANMLTFDLVCPGPNAAAASARYELHEQDFDGTISMTMGGKNMTMTETQRGRRTGACRDPA